MENFRCSVIVASYNSRRTIGACLNSLRRQDFPDPFEVIVVDSSSDGTDALIREEFPEVVLVHCSGRKYPGDARNLGIARAGGDIICLLDSDCVASPDWLSQVVRAHSAPDPVIGGSIANIQSAGRVGWASYFTEFSRWMPGTSKKRFADIAACNLTFKRWILDDVGPFGEGWYCEDTVYFARMRRLGHSEPLFDPAIQVAHDGIPDLGRFLAHEIHHGQSYARVRISLQGLTLLRRLSYVLAVPLIHLVLCWRVIVRVLANRRYVVELVRAFPLLLLGLLAWSFGEGLGYLQGARTGATLVQEES